jgi:hypothetical protein
MRVKDLISQLKKQPQNALVEVAIGICEENVKKTKKKTAKILKFKAPKKTKTMKWDKPL